MAIKGRSKERVEKFTLKDIELVATIEEEKVLVNKIELSVEESEKPIKYSPKFFERERKVDPESKMEYVVDSSRKPTLNEITNFFPDYNDLKKEIIKGKKPKIQLVVFDWITDKDETYPATTKEALQNIVILNKTN